MYPTVKEIHYEYKTIPVHKNMNSSNRNCGWRQLKGKKRIFKQSKFQLSWPAFQTRFVYSNGLQTMVSFTTSTFSLYFNILLIPLVILTLFFGKISFTSFFWNSLPGSLKKRLTNLLPFRSNFVVSSFWIIVLCWVASRKKSLYKNAYLKEE